MPRGRRPLLLAVAGVCVTAGLAGCAGSAAEGGAPGAPGASTPTSSVAAASTTTSRAPGTPRTTSLPELPVDVTVAPPRRLKGEDVAVFGDSLTEGVEDELPDLVDDYGFTVRIDALSGRDIEEGLKPLRTMVAKGGDALVVALGTNDARKSFTAADYRQRIEDVFAIVGGTMPVLWVNVYRDDDTQAGRDADAFNAELDAATLRHDNLTVLDWDGYVHSHMDVMAEDRIHLTDEGYTARAAWMARLIADHLLDAKR